MRNLTTTRAVIGGLVATAMLALPGGAHAASAASSPLTVTPTTLAFGHVVAGDARTTALTVRNRTPTQTLAVAWGPITGSGATSFLPLPTFEPGSCFVLGPEPTPRALGPGESCQITYAFAPVGAGDGTKSPQGNRNANATVRYWDVSGLPVGAGGEATFPLSAPATVGFKLSGTGDTARVKLSPSPLDLGHLTTGASTDAFLTVTNGNPVPMRIAYGGLATAGTPFTEQPGAYDGSCTDAAGTPVSIAAGGACLLRYRFRPTVTGAKTVTARVALLSDGGRAVTTLNATVKGTGDALHFTIGPPRGGRVISFGSVPRDGGSALGVITAVNESDVPLDFLITLPDFPTATAPFVWGDGDDACSRQTQVSWFDHTESYPVPRHGTCRIWVRFLPSPSVPCTGKAVCRSYTVTAPIGIYRSPAGSDGIDPDRFTRTPDATSSVQLKGSVG